MRRLASLLLLLTFSGVALADNCAHTQPRQLALELEGIKAVVFEVGQHELRLTAAPGATAALNGRACASDEKNLSQLTVTQQKAGDKLIVSLKREGRSSGIFFGNNYAYLEMAGSLPDTVTVQLKVGSGDAWITGAPVVSVDVGSGDAEVNQTRGLVAGSVGSGDLNVNDAGSLRIISIGSGDVTAKAIRGAVNVGSIGSGDFSLDGAQAAVEIGSIGSGDAEMRNINGDVRVGSLGSGDIEARAVTGDFTVASSGSGSIRHDNISGQVNLPAKR